MKQNVLLIITAALWLIWCSSIPQQDPWWYFWLFYKEFPSLKVIDYAQFNNSYENLTTVSQIRSKFQFDWKLIGTWFIDTDRYWTVEIKDIKHKKNSHEQHNYSFSIFLQGSWSIYDSSVIKIDATMKLLHTQKSNDIYIFIDTLTYDRKWRKVDILHNWILLMQTQEQKRIKLLAPKWLYLIENDRRLSEADNNLIKTRRMEWLNWNIIYSAEWETMRITSELSSVSEQHEIEIKLLDTILLLIRKWSWYIIEWDISKDTFQWTISWEYSLGWNANKFMQSSFIEINLPKWLVASIDTKHVLKKTSDDIVILEIPKRYIDSKTLFAY